jgi:ribose transport system permease protein
MTLELPIPSPRRFNLPALVETLLPLAALVLLIIATAICEHFKNGTDDFLTPGNLLNVLRTQSPVGIVAIGMTFAIILGGIDLSVGSKLGMAGTVGMWAMIHLKGSDATVIALGLPIMVGVGLFAGILNGVLITKGRIAPFIATLGGLAAYRSIAETIADNGTLNLIDNPYLKSLGQHGLPIPFLHLNGRTLELHYSTILFFTLAIIAGIVLNRTRFGRYVIAIGGNERAAAYSAISVDRVKILTYTGVGVCCGIAAILFSARQASVSSPQAGQLYELDAIAAVVIGGTRMTGGRGSIVGTVIGVLILGVINNMLNFLDIPDTLQGLVKGGIIVGAVLVQRVGTRRN